MNDTFVFIIIDCLLLIMSILFFSKYNNGKGGSLGSFRKRVLYFFSVLLFIGAGGNLAASNIRNLECPSYEVYLIDYGCGKFNKKVHIME